MSEIITPTVVSDLIKIGIPSIIAIATAAFAYRRDIKLGEASRSHDLRTRLVDRDLESIDQIVETMSKYFELWFEVLKKQGTKIEERDGTDWTSVYDAWNKLNLHAGARSEVVARLHILDNKAALDVISTSRQTYEEHAKIIQNRMAMSHQDLQELGSRIGGERNDFYRAMRKSRIQVIGGRGDDA
ncbi:MAG: hypothetical protein R3E82_23295 [Pseudomonadales bacterium]